MSLLYDTYKLLKDIQKGEKRNFSGIGLVIYDESSFDSSCHCDLRPSIKCPQYNVRDGSICSYLIDIADYNHTLHDGFHMINSKGDLTHVAQYFVPPVVKELMPNLEHGVRLYSSMCGSVLNGVLFIATISSNNDINIFQNGNYLVISEMEEKTYANH